MPDMLAKGAAFWDRFKLEQQTRGSGRNHYRSEKFLHTRPRNIESRTRANNVLLVPENNNLILTPKQRRQHSNTVESLGAISAYTYGSREENEVFILTRRRG